MLLVLPIFQLTPAVVRRAYVGRAVSIVTRTFFPEGLMNPVQLFGTFVRFGVKQTLLHGATAC